MSDDLTATVREAVRLILSRGLYQMATDALPYETCAAAVTEAALDAIIAQGGVTDEDIESAAEGTVERSAIAVRDLMARAIVTACAERDAEIERLRGGNDYPELVGLLRGSLTEPETNAPLTQAERDDLANVLVGNAWYRRRLVRQMNDANARAERAEAQVQRIGDEIEAAGRSDVEFLARPPSTAVDRARLIGAEDAWKAALRIAREGGGPTSRDEALHRIADLAPKMRRTQAELRKARQEHPELFPPHVPPLFPETDGEADR